MIFILNPGRSRLRLRTRPTRQATRARVRQHPAVSRGLSPACREPVMLIELSRSRPRRHSGTATADSREYSIHDAPRSARPRCQRRCNAGVFSTLFSTQFNTSTGRLAHDTNRASRDAHTRTGASVTRSLVTELRSGSEIPPRIDAIATTQLPRAPRSDGVFARVSACAP